jgi:phosphoglucomutase
LAAEAAAWCRATKGMTLYEWLQDLYVKFGFYRESLVNVVRKGKDGAELIQDMMVEFRANPPKSLLGSPVVQVYDYKTLELLDVASGVKSPIEGVEDKSNVLQWISADGTKVSVRPSGTEPKIKFYFGVKADLPSVEQFDEVQAALDAKIEQLKEELKLN